ncbi:MAG: PepSY-associated TM helix domain-containing protein [Pseudomonadota bacterium]
MPDTSTDIKPKPSARKKSARKKLYALHSWLGFHLAAIMALVLATGTMATISHEVDWVFQHDMRVIPDGEQVSWGEMQSAVQAYKPGATIGSLTKMQGDFFAYRADVTDEYGQRRFVHVNQWTGEVTGETHPMTVQRVFRDLHRYLFMPNFIGLPIVTSLAFVLAVALYTGLKTTRNWRTLLFRVRTDKGARIMWGDAHKASGLWGIWFFVVMIVTGIWYLIEFGVGINYVVNDKPNPIPSALLSVEQVVEIGQVMPTQDLDAVVEAAQAAYPGLNIKLISFPRAANGTYFVQGMVGNPLIRPRSNGVFLHPETLDVLQVRKSKDYPAFFYVNEMADPLHFGYFGGLPTKLIWFVFGIAMTGLSITGVWLTWRRLKTMSPSKAQYATLPVLVLSMYFFTIWFERFQYPTPPNEEATFGTAALGEVSARATLARASADAEENTLRFAVLAETGKPMVKTASLQIWSDTQLLQDIPDLRFRGLRQTAIIEQALSASDVQDAARIRASVVFNDESVGVFEITRAPDPA